MFEIKQPSKILVGNNSCQNFQFEKKCLVITSNGAKKRGWLDYLGIDDFLIFDNVEPNPSIETTTKIIDEFHKSEIDSVIGLGGGSSLDVAKFVGKESKIDQNFMIIARTEALIAGFGIDEALKRATAYENAGADAILIHSKSNTPQEIFDFCNKWKGNIPLVVVPTSYGRVTIDQLISHNIKMIIYANQTLRIAHKSMSQLLKKLKNANSLDEVNNEISSMNEIFELQKMFEIHSQEKNLETKLKSMGYIN